MSAFDVPRALPFLSFFSCPSSPLLSPPKVFVLWWSTGKVENLELPLFASWGEGWFSLLDGKGLVALHLYELS